MPKGTGSADTEPDGATVELCIDASLSGRRLDQALATLLPELSRARLQALVRAGRVRLNGAPCRPRASVDGGDRVCVRLPAPPGVVTGAEALELQVLHADDDIIVLDKPAGLVVHPGAGNPAGTLLNALLHHFPGVAALPRAGIVHRLDKDTSGVMVVAASERAHRDLTAQLERRSMTREYLAVVQGCPTGPGRVDAPIGRHPRQRTRMAVVAGGRAALSHFRIEERFARHAALAVRLSSGRTHQIRVHMAHIGLPLVGDPLYGGRARPAAGLSEALRATLAVFPRQALHARLLTLLHPAHGALVRFGAALPEDLAGLLAALRDAAPGAAGGRPDPLRRSS